MEVSFLKKFSKDLDKISNPNDLKQLLPSSTWSRRQIGSWTFLGQKSWSDLLMLTE